MFLASENIDFTGLSHVFLLGGGETVRFSYFCPIMGVHSFIVGINGWIFLYKYQNGFIKVAVMQHIMGERLWDCV